MQFKACKNFSLTPIIENIIKLQKNINRIMKIITRIRNRNINRIT